jgi:hypothetical protein
MVVSPISAHLSYKPRARLYCFTALSLSSDAGALIASTTSDADPTALSSLGGGGRGNTCLGVDLVKGKSNLLMSFFLPESITSSWTKAKARAESSVEGR